jgi:hypothetical protein
METERGLKIKISNTYLLTPWSRVLPEKLKRPELLKKFPALRSVIATTSITKSRLQESLKLLKFLSCSVYFNAKSSNHLYMPHDQKVFGITMNTKCLLSETLILLRTS